MDKLLKIYIGSGFMILFAPILGAIMGYFGGWTVGLMFDETIHMVVRELLQTDRLDGISLAQFGATAAFFASWIKPSNYTAKNA